MRLIDADKMLYELTHWKDSNGWSHDNGIDVYHISDIKMVCDRMPTVDAVERKRGRWIPIVKGERGYSAGDFRCSVCGEPCKCYHLTHFCSNCGAEMRKGEEG